MAPKRSNLAFFFLGGHKWINAPKQKKRTWEEELKDDRVHWNCFFLPISIFPMSCKTLRVSLLCYFHPLFLSYMKNVSPQNGTMTKFLESQQTLVKFWGKMCSNRLACMTLGVSMCAPLWKALCLRLSVRKVWFFFLFLLGEKEIEKSLEMIG
jgi:hypothetical protein